MQCNHGINKRRRGCTVNAAIDDREELLIAARITEELGVDRQRAALSAAAGLAQRVLYVEVTVARVRHATASGAGRVVASVSGSLEHEHHCRGPGRRIPAADAGGDGGAGVAGQIEHGVEAGVATPRRRQRPTRRVDNNSICISPPGHHAVFIIIEMGKNPITRTQQERTEQGGGVAKNQTEPESLKNVQEPNPTL